MDSADLPPGVHGFFAVAVIVIAPDGSFHAGEGGSCTQQPALLSLMTERSSSRILRFRVSTLIMKTMSDVALSKKQREELVEASKTRFEKNMHRHKNLEWARVQTKLEASPEKLWSLNEMDRTGGEPDVVGHDKKTGEYIFYDCSAESPKGRRSVCYDREALEGRKEHKPKDSAVNMATAMGIELLTEEQYRELQKLGEFDTKTSSWVKTPPEIRKLDGALFCDRRYDHVFVYHNVAESYYAARAFRGSLRVSICGDG